MAFRAPSHHPPQRSLALPQTSKEQLTPSYQPHSTPEEAQDWILFPRASPFTEEYSASSARTGTAGRSLSHVGDFASLRTDDGELEEEDDLRGEQNKAEEQDGEDFDDLDGHLQEFRENRYWSGEGAVLPAHDGLGSFRVDREVMGQVVQEHLARFERFTRKRSREDGEEVDDEGQEEQDRRRRIEEWRMEQSRLLVEVIQKETRRKRTTVSSADKVICEAGDKGKGDTATLADVEEVNEGEDNFWTRITKKVIHDLMGLDEDLLSIIFGEKLPDDDLSATLTPNQVSKTEDTKSNDGKFSWEYRLISRIARELGLLVNHFSHHPGAFSTYLQMQQETIPYAGLAAIPEQPRDPAPAIGRPSVSSSIPDFKPTLQNLPQHIATSSSTSPSRSSDAPLTKQDWERDLDLTLVFRYLRSRFSSFNRTSSLSTTSHLHRSPDTPTARAAKVRAQHPLIREKKRTWRSLNSRRGSESCGSEARMSMATGRRSDGSSTHYWDWGGSATGLSGVSGVSGRGMGSWGAV